MNATLAIRLLIVVAGALVAVVYLRATGGHFELFPALALLLVVSGAFSIATAITSASTATAASRRRRVALGLMQIVLALGISVHVRPVTWAANTLVLVGVLLVGLRIPRKLFAEPP